MRYIQLHDDSYIIHTSKGLKTIGNKSFNFHKIKKFLANGGTEEQLDELLITPALPNGIYEVYCIPKIDKLYYIHSYTGNDSKLTMDTNWLVENDDLFTLRNINHNECKFVGVYASKEDIIADWPEYFL